MSIAWMRQSLAERCRAFLNNTQRYELLDAMGISPTLTCDLQTLYVLQSVRAVLSDLPELLVDVGAHRGDFAAPAWHVLKPKHVVCFEPNPAVLPELARRLQAISSEIRPVALGSAAGESSLNVHQDPSMSSLLEADTDLLRTHFGTYDSDRIQSLRVPVSTLDIELADAVQGGLRFILKLDTQGTELAVLKGGDRVLEQCDAILTEFMFTTPYLNQAPFEDLIHFLVAKGFRCRGALNIYRKRTGRVSGVDFLFSRQSSDATADA